MIWWEYMIRKMYIFIMAGLNHGQLYNLFHGQSWYLFLLKPRFQVKNNFFIVYYHYLHTWSSWKNFFIFFQNQSSFQILKQALIINEPRYRLFFLLFFFIFHYIREILSRFNSNVKHLNKLHSARAWPWHEHAAKYASTYFTFYQ